jgi:hypothetical protein
MADEQSPTRAARRIAVVIVHGVGEATPGYAINELVDTMQREFPSELQADRHSELHPLSAPPLQPGGEPDPFPAFARTAHIVETGERVRFYELYWADLTRVLPGRLNAFLGAFRIIFESHQFIDAILPKDGGPLTRLLRRLLLVAAATLRGPIAALNICLIAIALVFYFAAALFREGPTGEIDVTPDQMIAIVLSVMAVVALVALVFYWRRWWHHHTEWNDVYIATFVGAFFVGGLTLLIKAYPRVSWIAGKDFADKGPVCGYVDRFFYITQSLWVFWGVLMLVALGTLGVLAVRRSEREARAGAAEAAVGIVAIQSALWIALICIFALPLVRQATLQGMKICSLDRLFFFFAGAAAWSVVVGGVALAIYGSRWLLARAPLLSLERKARLTPRMLFGQPIIFAIIVGIAVNVLLLFGQFLDLFGKTNVMLDQLSSTLGFQGKGTWLQQTFEAHRSKFYAATSALAAGAGLLMAGGFTTAIHIARDLIDHQYNPKLGYSYYLLPRRGRRGVSNRPRRLRLRERLNELSREVICREAFDDVVFVVHSQGSLIAYDYLWAGGIECERLLGARPHLVTFGSPLTHLYEFYFREYSALKSGIEALRPRLASWTNLYRVDDYVGREIADGTGTFIRNTVMPAGGHIDYWKEPTLARVVFDRIRTPGGGARATTPAAAPGAHA